VCHLPVVSGTLPPQDDFLDLGDQPRRQAAVPIIPQVVFIVNGQPLPLGWEHWAGKGLSTPLTTVPLVSHHTWPMVVA
jgi:hypothetical protein